MLAGLNAFIPTHDTPRGLVAVVPDSFFEPGESGLPRPTASERLMRLTAFVSARPGLALRVEGYMDDRTGGEQANLLSERRAEAVRATLVRDGVNPNSVSAVGFGKARPLASNATASGREENRRVEIVISGSSIGGMPLWERTYSLKPAQ